MSARVLILALVGAGCVAAAGAGGYFALRLNESERAMAAPATEAVSPDAVNPVTTTADQPGEPAARPAATDPIERPAPRVEAPAPRATRPPARDAGRTRVAVEPPAPVLPEPELLPPPPVLPSPGITPPASAPVELPPPPPEPLPALVELTIPADAVVGVRLETSVSSETARVEDPVIAIVTRDVLVDGRVAIPAQSRLEGNVSVVEPGGSFKQRARLELRFTTLRLGESTRVRIQTEPIFRDGESPKGEAASKIGASAVVGAIIGSVIGGKKGAVIGGSAGAAGGTAAVAAGGANAATLSAGSVLTVKLARPVTVLVEREPAR